VTLAVEIPIWLHKSDIDAIETRWGISLAPKVADSERVMTGHIDFLQVRNGAVHLLDYKPDATTNKPFAQLTVYALALSHLSGIPLFDFKCAWFNEHQYCEFFPARFSRATRPSTSKSVPLDGTCAELRDVSKAGEGLTERYSTLRTISVLRSLAPERSHMLYCRS